MCPDLTPKEREEGKTLREQLKKRRDEGEDNLVIRGNKFVKLTPRTQRHTAAAQLMSDQTEPNVSTISLVEETKTERLDNTKSKNEHKTINYMKIMYTNADALTNKMIELQLLASDNKADIIIVTEIKPKYSLEPTNKQVLK